MTEILIVTFLTWFDRVMDFFSKGKWSIANGDITPDIRAKE